MRALFTSILIFLLSDVCAQPYLIELKDGQVQKAVDWYIEATTKRINLKANPKISSLNEMGVVVMDFHKDADSAAVYNDPDSLVNVVQHFPQSHFRISIGFKEIVSHHPPSYYFIRKGVLGIIYNGFEEFIEFRPDTDFSRKYDGLVSSKPKVYTPESIIYIIKIDPRYKDGFQAKDVSLYGDLQLQLPRK